MWRGISLLLCLLACAASLAQEKKDASPLSPKAKEILSKLGLKSDPVEGHALFYSTGGAAAGSITLIPPPGSGLSLLKKEMTSLLSSFPNPEIKQHSSLSSLRLTWKRSHFGLLSSEVRFPLLEMSKWMARHGAKSTFVFRAGSYVKLSPSLEPEQTTRTTNVYVVREASQDLTLSAAITPLLAAGLVFFLFWPPLVLAGSILKGVALTRDPAKTRHQLRTQYTQAVSKGLGWALLPHMPVAYYFISGGGIQLFNDLWTGGTTGIYLAIGAIALPLLPLLATAPALTAYEYRRFGPSQELLRIRGEKFASFEAHFSITRQIQAVKDWSKLAAPLILLALLLGVQRNWFSLPTAVALLFGAAIALAAVFAIKDPRHDRPVPELNHLQEKSDQVSSRLGITPPRLVPIVRKANEIAIVPLNEGRHIACNPVLVTFFSPDEQEHLLIKALLTRSKGKIAPPVLGLLCVTALVILVYFGFNNRSLSFLLFPLLGLTPVAALVLFLNMAQKVLPDADAHAVVFTGNLEAALSVMRKTRQLLGRDDPETEAEFQKELDEFSEKARRMMAASPPPY